MALNLAALEVHEDVDIPKARRGRPASGETNPMLATFQASIDGGYKNLGIPNVPAEDTRELVNLIRYAANELTRNGTDVGARVYLSNTDGQELGLARKTNDDGTSTGLDIVIKASGEPWTGPVNVSFRAQKRKARKDKPSVNGDTAVADDSVGDGAVPTGDESPDAEAETVTEDSTPPAGRRRRR